MPSGSDTGKDMLQHEGEEGGVIIQGEIELTVADQVRILGPGDAYYFESKTPHRFRNIGKAEAILVSANTPATF
jgi:mannose-6-phosphate isomerase-like protein (cupin superfamily)